MATGSLILKQVKKDKNVYYYFGHSNIGGISNFCIEINVKDKIIIFYDSTDLKNRIGLIHLDSSDPMPAIKSLNKAVSNRTAMLVYKALLNNELPQTLSWEG